MANTPVPQNGQPWSRSQVPPRPLPPRPAPPLPYGMPPSPFLFNPYIPGVFQPPIDPDTAWLNEFASIHLAQTKHQEETSSLPTMREIRLTLFTALRRIRECRHLHEEMERFALMHQDTSVDPHVRTRSKLQFDRRNEILTRTWADLQEQYNDFFGDEAQLSRVKAIIRRIHRKKLYRRKAKKSTQAHRAVLHGLQAADSEAITTDSPEDIKVSTQSHHQHLQHLRSKLQLLIDLKAARGGANAQPIDKHVAEFIASHAPQPRREKSVDVPQVAQEKPTQANTLPLRDEDMTMDSLVAVRQAWDAFLTSKGGSRIPPHFVTPPQAPTSPWQQYVQEPNASI
ncbi:hypothetical protein LEN26_019039 [Aphanomyces euteiches]|nr:hypothetical protein LEN26_019039 [Aphanomyces euteiches]KAH9116348.1 hypothetical protein AeMF1_009710 [Aphanomyces euteiches]KAH9192685.1 hypothetical protein AeNC1_005338 [Aphanomyces euteiches]